MTTDSSETTQASSIVTALSEQLAAEPEPASEAPAVSLTALPLVLIVVSDPVLRNRVAVEIGRRGMRSALASTAEDVAVQVDRERPAVALIDLSGAWRSSPPEEILEALSGGTAPVPTVALAASDDFAARTAAARRGAEGFIDRAAPIGDIMDRVALLVERKSITGARVIVVDEDAAALASLQTLLERGGFDVTALGSPAELWPTLGRVNPSLVIMHVGPTETDGLELCRVLRNEARWALVPIMVLSSSDYPDTVERAFAAGADDYLMRPVDEGELIVRARSQLERYRLHQALAETDALTGLANRRTSTAAVGQMIRLADRMEKPMCLIEIDIDHFKQVNDRYGHMAGDVALRGLADLLRRTVRAEDITARWGGEEFVLGMFGLDRHAAMDRIADLLAEFRKLEFPSDDQTFQLSFSAGVAQYPRDGRSLDALYKAADTALYTAKSSGRNQVAGAASEDGVAQQVADVAIIEDDDATAALIAHGLNEAGMRWWRFSNGASAATSLCGSSPKLRARVVLLDIGIPAVDGLEVLSLLQKDGVLETTRVYALTARTDEESRRLTLELGATEYITKPFSLPDVMRAVTEGLGR